MPTPEDPIADDEILYRRIPAALNLYDPAADSRVRILARRWTSQR